mgnify:CR=1 FL=1
MSGTTTNVTGATGTSSDSAAPPPIVFDLGTVPDAPGTDAPFDGLPETCAEAESAPSTVGCSFRATRMQNAASDLADPDTSVVVGNVSETQTATVQLYLATSAGEMPQGPPVEVAPLQSHEFGLSSPPEIGNVSVLRDEGTYRVESTRPLVAYQHSPIEAIASNDSSVLIPDHALGRFHVVASWPTTVGGLYSAFNVIAAEDATEVLWQPPHATAAGTGVPAVAAFDVGQVTLDMAQMLQVVATVDTSGTIVETSKPAWVIGTSPCANVPAGVTFCDHIEEVLIPVEYWGTHYVGAHAPQRGGEQYWWRVYAGADATTISTDPPQPGFPVVLDRGQFHEFTTYDSVIFTGDAAFMPVQYLEGQDNGAGTGDPASFQSVPTEQFLRRYVFVTGVGYEDNYVQVIREVDGANVYVDGELVNGYETFGGFAVADWPIDEGPHYADSEEPFGVIQVGYTDVTSYAYPGGLALAPINPEPEG